MMGGPIDTREAPTAVNTLATQRPFSWFENNVIATVPMIYPGAGRKVYPGFLQLAGFMTMNLGSHLISHWEMFKHLVVGDEEGAEPTQQFYEEYRSVCDMTAEFYLQTVDVVFQRHLLPKGELMHRGRRVDPAAIRDTALLAIEGERDDISGIGQTKAALDIAEQAAQGEEAIFHGQGRRPLRHLQRPQMAREDRSGARGLHRRQRAVASARTRGQLFIFTSPSMVSATTLPNAATAAKTSSRHGSRRTARAFAGQDRAEQSGRDQAADRATALLKPDAMATCCSSTDPSTDEVSGATAMRHSDRHHQDGRKDTCPISLSGCHRRASSIPRRRQRAERQRQARPHPLGEAAHEWRQSRS